MIAAMREGREVDVATPFTEGELDKMRTEAGRDPLVATFRRLSFTEAMNVYAIANKKERALLWATLEGKRGRAKRDWRWADQDRMYHELEKLPR